MLIALWIINALLAIAFLGAGMMKLVRPREALTAGGMAWVDDFTPTSVKLIGLLEIVGALGLVVPLFTGIAPVLTPLAATGLAIVMIGASVVHVRRRESAAPSIALAALAVVSAALGFATTLG